MAQYNQVQLRFRVLPALKDCMENKEMRIRSSSDEENDL